MRKASKSRKIDVELIGGLALCIASIVFVAMLPSQKPPIAVSGEDGNGNHYKYVNTYELKAKYDGVYFIDTDGEAWKTDGEYTKGKVYTLEMSNNGTEGILDDVILSVR